MSREIESVEHVFNHKLLAVLGYNKETGTARIGKSTGLSHSTISYLMSGKIKNPGIDTVKRIADYFKKDINEFIIEKNAA